MRIDRALFFSDVHLGWVPVVESHERWLAKLPEAIDDAELIVLNGDIIDAYRGRPSARVRELIARFVELIQGLRREGRRVVFVEGNHDVLEGELVPEVWSLDLEGTHGERIRVLHGHKFADAPHAPGPYERFGHHFLRFENWCYSRAALLRAIYPHSIGWIVGAVGLTEDVVWRPSFYDRTRNMDVDVLVHGHYHFGPGRVRVAGIDMIRTGAWVSRGHLGTVDRMLRYERGKFERITLEGDRWIAPDDGR